MIQLLPQENILQPNSCSVSSAVDFISNYINTHNCKELNVDISNLNILDACHVSTLCSTKHFIKYPNGKIRWKISSELVEEFNKKLELGNSEYFI